MRLSKREAIARGASNRPGPLPQQALLRCTLNILKGKATGKILDRSLFHRHEECQDQDHQEVQKTDRNGKQLVSDYLQGVLQLRCRRLKVNRLVKLVKIRL